MLFDEREPRPVRMMDGGGGGAIELPEREPDRPFLLVTMLGEGAGAALLRDPEPDLPLLFVTTLGGGGGALPAFLDCVLGAAAFESALARVIAAVARPAATRLRAFMISWSPCSWFCAVLRHYWETKR